jgi:hypothetical protein
MRKSLSGKTLRYSEADRKLDDREKRWRDEKVDRKRGGRQAFIVRTIQKNYQSGER